MESRGDLQGPCAPGVGSELTKERVRLNTGRKIFNMRAIRHRKPFPREFMLTPSLEDSQSQLDKDKTELMQPCFE